MNNSQNRQKKSSVRFGHQKMESLFFQKVNLMAFSIRNDNNIKREDNQWQNRQKSGIKSRV
ncbi:unnamed protein product [Paramecium sonneborni]|uniref:Uncharacterized protein n=1 Tax=Paramecium sonneborni TaxID=65129 RepID=A0A8S1QEE0_9CILI|nr:unnamed protein product [Paramecium sonneborni]